MNFIIFHANCNDGKGAAAVTIKALSEHGIVAKSIAWDYGRGLPTSMMEHEHIEDVYVVDFSFQGKDLLDLAERAKRVIIIDHHEFALNKIREMEQLPSNVELFEDQGKSGALLCWEYFYKDVPVPELILDISDRDLFTFHRTTSKATHLGIQGAAIEDVIKCLAGTLGADNLYREYLIKGQSMLELHERYNQYLAETAFLTETNDLFNDLRVAFVNSPYVHMSDTGKLILDSAAEENSVAQIDAVALYYVTGKTVKLSFRSRKGTDYALKLAQNFGGGGHAAAAGAGGINAAEWFNILDGLKNNA